MFYEDTEHVNSDTKIDTFENGISKIEEEDSSRRDAMGDLLSPSTMTLDDFMKEWSFKDEGLERVPNKFKWQYEDRGWGRNKFSADANDTILAKLGEREEALISIFGLSFYNYCNRLFNQSITGDEEMKTWFKDGDQEIEMRAEALDAASLALQWYSMSLTVNDYIRFQPKLETPAIELHRWFKSNKDKRWSFLKTIIIENALMARYDTEKVNPLDVEACIQNCCNFLGINEASWMLKKFVLNMFWGVVKSRPEPKSAALIVKWANSISIQKTLDNKSDYIEKIDIAEMFYTKNTIRW